MGRLIRIDGSKLREELKSAEKSLEYWMDLKAKHPKGNTSFDGEISRASAKVDAFKFVLEQCVA